MNLEERIRSGDRVVKEIRMKCRRCGWDPCKCPYGFYPYRRRTFREWLEPKLIYLKNWWRGHG